MGDFIWGVKVGAFSELCPSELVCICTTGGVVVTCEAVVGVTVWFEGVKDIGALL